MMKKQRNYVCSKETEEALQNNGYDTLEEYLQDLADQHGIPLSLVKDLFEVLGESELFDGLVSSCQDAEESGEYFEDFENE